MLGSLEGGCTAPPSQARRRAIRVGLRTSPARFSDRAGVALGGKVECPEISKRRVPVRDVGEGVMRAPWRGTASSPEACGVHDVPLDGVVGRSCLLQASCTAAAERVEGA